MPKTLRQFEVGNVYQVFNRGYEKRNIFLDEVDHFRFIESLYYFNNEENCRENVEDWIKFKAEQATGVL